MIKFFYDSLDTLQKVTFPTKNDYVRLTIGIFVTVSIAGVFFILVDTVLTSGYRTFYTTMRPDGQEQMEQAALLSGLNAKMSGEKNDTVLSGMKVDAVITTGSQKK